jgi:iron(III) transport system substrate-binding protein
VTVSGPAGADIREALTQGFQQRYPDIAIDFTGQTGNTVTPRLATERQSGQYLVDVVVNGANSLHDLAEAQFLDPIRPYLSGPNARESPKWIGGDFEFADEGRQYIVLLSSNVKSPLAYNPRLVEGQTFRSYQDVLQPEWRSKIIMLDPRAAGAGLATMTFLYTTDSLGREFIRRFLAQDVAFTRDPRQVLERVTRGDRPIAFAPSEAQAADMQRKGLHIELLPGAALEEGSYLTPGVGNLAVVNRGPHPNATAVYLDWLLSREAMTDWSRAVGYTSRRTDVPTDHLDPALVPQEGRQYQASYKKQYDAVQRDVVEYIRSLIGS